MARVYIEVQNMEEQIPNKTPVTKDLSLVALVPKLFGTDKAISLLELL